MKISQQRTWTNVSEGSHQGVCCDVLDLGHQMRTFKGENKGMAPHTRVVFQVEEQNEEGYRLTVRSYMMPILWDAKSNWRKMLDKWLGGAAVDQILATGEFDPESLIGRNAMLTIEHETRDKDGGKVTYANISSVTPWDTKFGPPIAVDTSYKRQCDQQGYQAPVPSAFEDPQDAPAAAPRVPVPAYPSNEYGGAAPVVAPPAEPAATDAALLGQIMGVGATLFGGSAMIPELSRMAAGVTGNRRDLYHLNGTEASSLLAQLRESNGKTAAAAVEARMEARETNPDAHLDADDSVFDVPVGEPVLATA